MNRRVLAFLIIFWLFFGVMLLLQSPPDPPAKNAPHALNQETGSPASQSTIESSSSEVPLDAPRASQGGSGDENAPPPGTDPAVGQREADDDAKQSPGDLLFPTIGSLDAKSPYHYLITINPVGGAIRRVELNFHESGKTQFKYRDLENVAGYLGSLDCFTTPQGCLIRTVGHGTPAFQAQSSTVEGGIRAGDILLAVDGEPIVSSVDFENWLAQTKPGTEVQVSVKRAGEQPDQDSTISFTVDLIRKPIQVFGPEDNEFLPPTNFPESFLLSLLKPMSVQDAVWPELDEKVTTARWAVDSLTEGEIVVSYQLDPTPVAARGFQPLKLVKRYGVPSLDENTQRMFHFDLDIRIENASNEAQTVTYQLDGPSGLTTETWWYTHKIHGRSTAIGYSAGARDVIGSTQYNPFVFFGCPEIADGAAAARPYPQYVASPHVNSPKERLLNFVGVDAQYFNVSLIPQIEPGNTFDVNSVTAFPIGPLPPLKKYHRLANCSFQLFKTIEIEPQGHYQQTFEIFAGPKEPEVLTQYGLDDIRTFGWFAWLSKPLMSILHFFYWTTGNYSYGIAIVMLTVLVRSLMIPISRKAALNAQMMQMLQPQMQEIRDKYKENPEKQASATRDLFRKYRYNPLSGCFLGLLQLPIFLGLFRGLSVDIALRDKPLIPGMQWCNNLAAPDQLLNWESWMPAFLSDKLGFFGPYLNILPLITVALFLVQQKMFMPPPTDDQQRLMQKVMTFMMIFMGFLFFKVAAGLCVYFITSSTWGILERKLLPKPELDHDKLAAMEDGKPSTGGFLQRIKALQEKTQKPQTNRPLDTDERKQRNSDRKKRLKNRGQ